MGYFGVKDEKEGPVQSLDLDLESSEDLSNYTP
jgi:hypothetical protein